jgi:YggT family protein
MPNHEPVDSLLGIVFNLADAVIALIMVVLIVYVVVSWLFAFDIVSRRNPFANSIYEFTSLVSDPMLRPLRRLIPPIAGVDLSVFLLLLCLQMLVRPLLWWTYRLLVGPV